TAGVLRSKFTINWSKDRCNDPTPNATGTTERHNDRHLTLAEKRAARKARQPRRPPTPLYERHSLQRLVTQRGSTPTIRRLRQRFGGPTRIASGQPWSRCSQTGYPS